MKRLPSLLLSLVLSLALLVPVFAADACTEVSYTAFTCGKEMHFTEHYWTRLRRSSRSKAP